MSPVFSDKTSIHEKGNQNVCYEQKSEVKVVRWNSPMGVWSLVISTKVKLNSVTEFHIDLQN